MTPIDRTSLRYAEEWAGRYKDVSFYVRKWSPSDKDCPIWNYYIFIHKKVVPPSLWANFIKTHTLDWGDKSEVLDYYNSHLCNIEFHGGITYANFRTPSIIEAGCDYNHYADEGITYSLDDILLDVANSITSYLTLLKEWKEPENVQG